MAKILVVDDDQGMREFLEIMLAKEGYNVTTVKLLMIWSLPI